MNTATTRITSTNTISLGMARSLAHPHRHTPAPNAHRHFPDMHVAMGIE